jgi:hypothetical protein
VTDSIKPSSTYRTNVRINTEDVVWPDCSILHEPLQELLRLEEERFHLYRGTPPDEWVALCRENPVLGTDEAIKRRIDSPLVESPKHLPPAELWTGCGAEIAGFVLWVLFVIFSGFFFSPMLGKPLSHVLHDLLSLNYIAAAIYLLWFVLFLVSALCLAGLLCWFVGILIQGVWEAASLAARSLADERYGYAWQEEFRRKEKEFVDEAQLQGSNMRSGVLGRGKGYYPWWECPSKSLLIQLAVDDLLGRVAGLDRRIELLEAKEKEWGALDSGDFEKYKRINGLLGQVAQAKEAVKSRSLALSAAYELCPVDSSRGSISFPKGEALRASLREAVGSLVFSLESAERFVEEKQEEYAYGAESARAWRKSGR